MNETGKTKILVVDDSKVIRKMVGVILRSNGYVVVEAEDGLDALEKLLKDDYNLLITDLNMPRMDGFTLIKEVRKDEYYKFIPIIMLTTEAGENERRKGIEVGANVYLTKPTVPEEILINIQKLLKR